MSNPSEFLKKVEYRVKPITRYIITRYEEGHDETIEEGPKTWAGTSDRGHYDNKEIAWEVAYALCQAEHTALGWPVGDDRIRYPQMPDENAGRGPG